MKIIRLSFFILCTCVGQTLPTIPNNVFRFSSEFESFNYYRVLDDVQFSLHGIGRHYFDNRTHNDSFRFSSNFDLYHTGSLALDTTTTVQAWLNNFNAKYNFSLPVFGPQIIDTTGGMSPQGVFSKEWDQSIRQKSIKIEYGMSDEITLSVKIPMIDSYVMNQSFFDYSVKPIAGAQILVDYHQNVKNGFNNFFSSDEYSNLRRGLRDTLQIIYNVYYTDGDTLFDGAHSVNWIFQSQIDPINNGLVDEMFIPNELTKNRVSLNDLVGYYYPQKKTGGGLNDIIIGTTILLKGTPAWSTDKPVDALYGRVNVSLPFGKTIKSFIDFVYDNNDKTKGSDQFKEASIGLGTNRFEIGLYGSKELIDKYNSRLFAQSMVHFSTMTTLNTPVQLFSGGHTKPDSILSLVGNTYKFDMGTGLLLKIGGELELVKNRLRFLSELSPTYKGRDNYSSKNPDWDSWMEKQSSASNYMDVKYELWFINSYSKNRLGPFSFDLFAGYRTRLFANNASLGWNAYVGITTFYQGW